MRVLSVESLEDREKLANFCDYLIKMGDGKLKIDSTGSIKLPERFLLPTNDPQGLLKWVYGDKPRSLPSLGDCSSAEYHERLEENITYYSDKAILCPKNVDVDKYNDEIMKKLYPVKAKRFSVLIKLTSGTTMVYM